MKKLEYSNNGSWPQNLNVLEKHVIDLTQAINSLIEHSQKQDEALKKLAHSAGLVYTIKKILGD